MSAYDSYRRGDVLGAIDGALGALGVLGGGFAVSGFNVCKSSSTLLRAGYRSVNVAQGVVGMAQGVGQLASAESLWDVLEGGFGAATSAMSFKAFRKRASRHLFGVDISRESRHKRGTQRFSVGG